ncbi:hypothetical protein [Pseudomonas putida]|uniref:hypothetical protein n=1 Tax=Pseudomonas putida TaxID=303 RepID=UPI0023649EFF|nr:hypothetical protein [Pseudomonas putida]MDD2145230.1 hypothetical protein [Pseudomonas putida]HDS1708402.1 hypothetical protein [Pseudomonas putida]
MLGLDVIKLTSPGRVTIEKGRILVEGFVSENATCREVVVMAAAWAIGELQREMLLTIERPGGGNLCIYEPLE